MARSDAHMPGWRENVGALLELDSAPSPPGPTPSYPGAAIAVLSWNVWIGRGRLSELIGKLREGAFQRLGVPPGLPLIVLVQEAFRADDSVPATASRWAPRVRPRDFRPAEEIAEVARRLELNLRYAPSMRNGAHRSDRGNAILATHPLEDVAAFELPFVIQRRVAVGATMVVGGAGGAPFRLRAYSAHLDPWGAAGRDWLGSQGRVLQSRGLLAGIAASADPSIPVALGADLNTARGMREAAYRLLRDAGFTAGVPHHAPSWSHTYHMVPRRTLDYLLFRPHDETPFRATVHRIDEHPLDAGPFVFGSDHHPLLSRVELDRPEEPPR